MRIREGEKSVSSRRLPGRGKGREIVLSFKCLVLSWNLDQLESGPPIGIEGRQGLTALLLTGQGNSNWELRIGVRCKA